MKIAIPTANDKLAMHFGHCESFTITLVEDNIIVSQESLTPPPHEPGILPKWLHEQGVNVIIAGGMGQRAQQLFAANNIEVIVGAPAAEIKTLIEAYLSDALETGTNACDH